MSEPTTTLEYVLQEINGLPPEFERILSDSSSGSSADHASHFESGECGAKLKS